MNKDQIKGVAKEAAGNVQQKAGEITGSAKQQLKGAAKQVEGSLQRSYGDAKESIRNANKPAK